MNKDTKIKLFNLLSEWTITETCDYCQHISTFRDGDMRHPCNKCDCHDKFKLANNIKEDLQDKVNQIIEIIDV